MTDQETYLYLIDLWTDKGRNQNPEKHLERAKFHLANGANYVLLCVGWGPKDKCPAHAVPYKAGVTFSHKA